jgi:nitrogen fixation NifU-like protein
MMHGDEEVAKDRSMGDLPALQGVSKFPVRIKCALLAFDALQEAIKESRSMT